MFFSAVLSFDSGAHTRPWQQALSQGCFSFSTRIAISAARLVGTLLVKLASYQKILG